MVGKHKNAHNTIKNKKAQNPNVTIKAETV